MKSSTLVGARAPCAKTLPANGTAASAAPAPSTARRVGGLPTSDMVNPPAVVFLAAPRARRAYIGLEFGECLPRVWRRRMRSRISGIRACDILAGGENSFRQYALCMYILHAVMRLEGARR